MDTSSAPEYCSLSERTVTPDSAIGFVGSSEGIVCCCSLLKASVVGLESTTLKFNRRPEDTSTSKLQLCYISETIRHCGVGALLAGQSACQRGFSCLKLSSSCWKLRYRY